MKNNKKTIIDILKKYTDIDKNFLNDLFSNFKLTDLEQESYDFDFTDIKVAKWLDIDIQTLKDRLRSKYKKRSNEELQYIEKYDYIRVRNGKNITYKITFICFENLAMQTRTENGEMIRYYFSKIREFIQINQSIIYQALDHKNKLNKIIKEAKNNGKNFFYIIAIDDRYNDIVKIGHTIDIIKRLRNYNVGRIKEVDLKYFALVRHPLLIENCLKSELNNKKIFENREIFNISPNKLKKMIDYCYCKYVSSKKNENLYKEISDLLGLYAYTKDKIHIKPYIIIGKNI